MRMRTYRELFSFFLEHKLNEMKRMKPEDFLYEIRNNSALCKELNQFVFRYDKKSGVRIDPSKPHTEEEDRKALEWLENTRPYHGMVVRACPFCGAMPYIEHNEDEDVYSAHCSNVNCNATLGVADTEDEALELWNRRPRRTDDDD